MSGKEAAVVYRPRHPQQSPFYQLACLRQANRGRQVERLFPQFETVYEERYQERYGFWRSIIGTVVRKFLECGSEMKIIAFIERRQTEVIEKILWHCGLWKESPARGPLVPGVSVEG